mmetsp:Transcript_24083/g.82137  ORF Transcript_24083/g.82137 Transcript_24083/m.82137 type:complete len:236 (-) Transcript_24083:1505-2212(-)
MPATSSNRMSSTLICMPRESMSFPSMPALAFLARMAARSFSVGGLTTSTSSLPNVSACCRLSSTASSSSLAPPPPASARMSFSNFAFSFLRRSARISSSIFASISFSLSIVSPSPTPSASCCFLRFNSSSLRRSSKSSFSRAPFFTVYAIQQIAPNGTQNVRIPSTHVGNLKRPKFSTTSNFGGSCRASSKTTCLLISLCQIPKFERSTCVQNTLPLGALSYLSGPFTLVSLLGS